MSNAPISVEDNEDPEVLAERAKRERDLARLRPKALKAGRISIWVMLSGFLIFVIIIFMDSYNLIGGEMEGCLYWVAIPALVVVGPIAALVDMILVIRLKVLGAKNLGWLIFLALPGIAVSTLLALGMLLRTMS